MIVATKATKTIRAKRKSRNRAAKSDQDGVGENIVAYWQKKT